MKIGLRLYATLRRYHPEAQSGKTIELTLTDGTRVGELVQALSIPRGTIKTVFVNGIIRDDEFILKDGDEVGMFPPVAGGSKH